MDQARSQQLIVGCLAASAAVAAGSSLADGDTPGVRMLVGVAFTGAGLATVSMFAPDLAGGLAVLVFTSTLFLYGGPLMNTVTDLTRAPSTKRTGTRRKHTTTTTKEVAA